jgi:hypothetical protein
MFHVISFKYNTITCLTFEECVKDIGVVLD